jgi:hypothetical protein
MAERKSKKKEDLILIFLIILGLGALVLGFQQFQATIKGNLAPQSNVAGLNEEEEQLKKLLALKAKDTDGDGLTDYDEIYLYHTSVYLADSDSDGYKDKEEITTGHDPLCPSDQSGLPCNQPLTKIDITQTSTPPFLATPSASSFNPQDIFSGTATPAAIRQMLLQGGMKPEDLDKITDEQLLETYQEVLTQGGGGLPSETKTNSNLNLNLSSQVSPENISAQELRELLIQEGVDTSLLDKIDDATLKQMFEEAVKKQ